MFKTVKNIISIVLFGMVSLLSAQQESLFTHYNEVITVFNPAVSGINSTTEFTALRRAQWSGVSMAPETFVFGVSIPTKGNVGFGINLVKDKTFVEQSTFVGIDYSYKLKLDEQTNLFLGLKAGAHAYEVTPGTLETFNPIFDSALESFSKVLPNLGVGLYLTHNNISISMAAPRMFNTERLQEEDGRAVFAKDRLHYYTSLDYRIDVNPKTTLNAIGVTRFVRGAPISFDFQGRLWYDSLVMLGGSYRTDKSLAGLLQLRVTEKFSVGWAYESHSRSDLANVGSSQEFVLMISL